MRNVFLATILYQYKLFEGWLERDCVLVMYLHCISIVMDHRHWSLVILSQISRGVYRIFARGIGREKV